MDTLRDKVAVVTGAASGIGRGLATVFGARGAKLVLADIDEDALRETAQRLRDDGVACITHQTDVSRLDSVQALADKTIDTYGSVDILCNNAGVATVGRQWELTDDDWAWVLGVDLWGPINGIRAFVPSMLASGQPGHIVNTASVGGLMAGPLVGPYSVAKHGVVGLSKGLRVELFDTNINVSVLCPGEVRTGIVPVMRKRAADNVTEMSEVVRTTIDGLDAAIREAMDPTAVAELVVDAIVNQRFWVLPNTTNYGPLITAEYDEILANISP